MAPKHNAKVLFHVPRDKKAMVYLKEKVIIIDKLYSGLSCSDVGHEFDINESTIYI